MVSSELADFEGEVFGVVYLAEGYFTMVEGFVEEVNLFIPCGLPQGYIMKGKFENRRFSSRLKA
jgi:hypothetical protein